VIISVPVRFLVARGDTRFADDATTLMKAAAAYVTTFLRR
jgi:hypothetical protein